MLRVLLVLIVFTTLYACGQPNSPAERQEKQAGVEEAPKGREPVKTVEEPQRVRAEAPKDPG